MSEFDAFETSAPEEDPAAGFIANQDKELAQLEDDNFGFENTTQPEQPPQGSNILKTGVCVDPPPLHVLIYSLLSFIFQNIYFLYYYLILFCFYYGIAHFKLLLLVKALVPVVVVEIKFTNIFHCQSRDKSPIRTVK